jgi:serine/threonine-protein kinase
MTNEPLTLFDLAPGKMLLDRYEILASHRRGGMSATLRVKDTQEDCEREIQVFHPTLLEDAGQANDFADRMTSWNAVNSPAVNRVLDVVIGDGGYLFLVTDLPPGASLRVWLNENGPMEAERVVRLALSLLAGLEEVHRRGLVHGDIKPLTIYLVPGARAAEERCVLVDGGITPGLWSAMHLGDKTALIGTPFYAPMEQFGGDAPTVQSDIYNLAPVLFELLTGVLPWKGNNFIEIFQAKLEKQPPPMRNRAPKVEVSAELERAIAGGLMGDHRDRYSSAALFRQELAAVAVEL